jgi:MFS superfamily sulfate permease-like transporter
MQNEKNIIPADGLVGLKNNFGGDLMSGFMVALLALPLSLGIASASDFPNPLLGVLTAIIGGLIVSLFMGGKLTIKGPAAGLIVIVAGSVSAFGGGETGWKLTLGAIVVAAFFQILFGLLKLGKLSDFFPLSVVQGMLVSIGLIIISKQLHVLHRANIYLT